MVEDLIILHIIYILTHNLYLIVIYYIEIKQTKAILPIDSFEKL